MKKLFLITMALVMALSLAACEGTTIKDDFKEYVNNKSNAIFIPENNDIVKTYTEGVKAQDGEAMVIVLSEILPKKNNELHEKLKAYTPETAEVKELHDIYIKAVELRKEGYEKMLEALTTKVSDEAATDIALAKLGEADTKFAEFETKRNSMMKDLGLVDASKN
jgi:uncharacterized lipoprotein YehR (DUF1307 family)